VLAETLVEIDFHVTLLTVRSFGPTGPTLDFCSPIGHGETIGDVQEYWQPQDMTPPRWMRAGDRGPDRQGAGRARWCSGWS